MSDEAPQQPTPDPDEAFLERLPDGHVLLEPMWDDDGELADLRCRYVNRIGCDLLGLEQGALHGHGISELGTTMIHEPFVAHGRMALQEGGTHHFDVAHFAGETVYHLDVWLFPWEDDVLCARFDLRQPASEGLDARARGIRDLMAVVGLSRAMIHRGRTPQDILGAAAQAVLQMGFTGAWFGQDDGGTWSLHAAEDWEEAPVPPERCLSCTAHRCLDGALVEGTPQQVWEAGDDRPDCPLLPPEDRAMLVLPLPGSEERVGVAYLRHKGQPDDRMVLAAQWIATDCGIALENWENRHRLQESEDQHRTLVELLGEGLVATDAEGVITFANPHVAGLLDLRRDRLVGRNLLDFVDERDRDAVLGCLDDPGTDVTPFPLLMLVDRHGEPFPTGAMMHRVRTAGGDVAGMMALVRDRTEELAAEVERQRAIELNQRILDTAPLGIIAVDREGRVTMFNEAFARIGQIDPAQMDAYIGTAVQESETTIRNRMVELLDQTLGGRAVTWNSAEFVLPDGSKRALDIHAVPLRDEEGEIDGVLGIVVDQTEQHTAAEALRRSEHRFRTLVEHLPAGLCILQQRRFVYVNPALTTILGRSREELQTTDPDELGLDWKSAELPEPDQILDSLELPPSPLQKARRPDGTVVNVEVMTRSIPYGDSGATLAIVTDVTREQALEAQLLRTHKMQSIGTLAGGIAHDFNNLLTGIAGYTGILRGRLEREGLELREADGIDRLRERGAEMTQKLLAFSRRQMIRPVPLDLNRLLADFAAVASRLIGEQVELVTVLDPACPFVVGDPVHLEQVLLNMAVNARDAMPEGGVVTFETRPGPPLPGEDVPSAELVVRDQGVGIPQEELQHIFEPFVSSKDAWETSGLGLAVVYGIVKQHRGSLTATSAEGQGTEFTIQLPGTSAAPAEPSAEHVAVPLPAASSETLLVAEDDDALRDLLCQVLESAGFRVIAAQDGDEAVELVRRHGQEIALVVLDMVMPRKGGLDALKEMRRVHPGLRTVLISGYSPDLARGDALGPEDPVLLTKPFTNDQLLQTIRQTLDS